MGSDRVVALPSPRPSLWGVWATVCHYPNARRNITHSKTGMLGAEMSEQEGGFQTRPVRRTCSSRLANHSKHSQAHMQTGTRRHAFTHLCCVMTNTHTHTRQHTQTCMHAHPYKIASFKSIFKNYIHTCPFSTIH